MHIKKHIMKIVLIKFIVFLYLTLAGCVIGEDIEYGEATLQIVDYDYSAFSDTLYIEWRCTNTGGIKVDCADLGFNVLLQGGSSNDYYEEANLWATNNDLGIEPGETTILTTTIIFNVPENVLNVTCFKCKVYKM